MSEPEDADSDATFRGELGQGDRVVISYDSVQRGAGRQERPASVDGITRTPNGEHILGMQVEPDEGHRLAITWNGSVRIDDLTAGKGAYGRTIGRFGHVRPVEDEDGGAA